MCRLCVYIYSVDILKLFALASRHLFAANLTVNQSMTVIGFFSALHKYFSVCKFTVHINLLTFNV